MASRGQIWLEHLSRVGAQSWWAGGAAFVAMLALSVLITGFILVRIAPEHFTSRYRSPLERLTPGVRLAVRIAKNIAGVLVVALGVVLSVPGVPGQGVLTILLGLMLLDVPGRRRAELWMLRRGRVLRRINHLRQRFGRPPLELDPAE